jgi:hypothetical protein
MHQVGSIYKITEGCAVNKTLKNPEISQGNKCAYNKTKIRNVALLGNVKFLGKTSSKIVSTHK